MSELDKKVAHAMGLKSANNCEQWGTSMNEKEINKAFDEEYIKYREAFPKDYDIPALAQTQKPPKYSFKAHWEKDGRIGVVAAIERSDGGVHILEDIIDMPQRTWVGLTNDELTDLFYNTNLGQASAVAQAIALLKEKNT